MSKKKKKTKRKDEWRIYYIFVYVSIQIIVIECPIMDTSVKEREQVRDECFYLHF